MAVFNALQFDNINSLDYGIYITGEAVYNSPERDVEVVSVPGRNGDILIDNGRYNNIEVTYRAGCFGANQDEFAQKIKAFRAVLASKKGYQRITDTYNPNEYRMGTFIKPIEVSKESYDRVGEFDIIFNCKPQRFLTTGETQISVNSGAKINNPTLFDAKPMVMVHGYGTLNIGDYVIELDGGLVGTVSIKSGTWAYVAPNPCVIDYSALPINQGDIITIDSVTVRNGVYPKSPLYISSIDGQSITAYSDTVMCDFGSVNLTAFPSTNSTETQTSSRSYELSNGVSFSVTLSATITNAPSGKITVSTSFTASADVSQYVKFIDGLGHGTITYINNVTADSTVSSVGDPTYIDCDIGEAYLIDGDGNVVSLNSLIELGSDLPVLSPGDTTITYDNTITAVEIVPRWWIL